MTIAHKRGSALPASSVSPAHLWPLPAQFENDPFPARPRILFVGYAESTHTHAWIDLLIAAQCNVRLFALPGGVPPDDWHVRTYVTSPTSRPLDARTRQRLYAAGRLARAPKRAYARFIAGDRALERRWLASIVREWKPDIVHTLGIDPAGELYYDVRLAQGLEGAAR